MTSIFENTKSKVTIHILHDDTLTEDNRKKFIRTAEKYSQGLELHDVTEYKSMLGDDVVKVAEQWTIGCCYKMMIPDVLAAVSKVIYLDCDVLVNMDIQELWNIDVEGRTLAAVKDVICCKIKSFSYRDVCLRLEGCDSKNYINSGVLIMNLAKIHEQGKFFGIASNWLTSHSHIPILPDQDAFNAIFRGDIKFIDAKFNILSIQEDMPDCVIHCAWIEKPWRFLSGFAPDRIYWKMYIRSPWGENMTRDEIIDKLAGLVQPSPYMHRHGIQCLKRIAASTGKRVMILFQPFMIVWLFAKDLLFRLKHKLTRR